MSGKKSYYAWLILVACFVLNMTVHCLVMQMSSLYIVPMYNDLQVPRTLLSMQSVIMTVGAVLTAPLWGKFYKKHDARFVLALCTGMTALTTIARSFMPNIWAILVLAAVKGVFFTGSTTLPISILLTVWFRKKRGPAVSIAALGISVGNVIFSPVVEYLISSFGWRAADQINGLIMLVVMVPISLFIVSSRPKSKGALPYGMDPAAAAGAGAGAGAAAGAAAAKKNDAELTGMTLAEARKTPMFWAFLVAVLGMTFATGAALQLVAYLTDIGYSSAAAARVLSAYSLVAIFGKLIMGAVTDKFGEKIGSIYACVAGILTFVCFIFAANGAALIGLIVFYGLGVGITSVLPTLLTAKIFGNRDYGPIYGMVVSTNRLGGVVGNVGVSLLFDITGNYSIIWPACVAAMVLTLVAILYCLNASAKANVAGAAA